jgi:hypothetical protein
MNFNFEDYNEKENMLIDLIISDLNFIKGYLDSSNPAVINDESIKKYGLQTVDTINHLFKKVMKNSDNKWLLKHIKSLSTDLIILIEERYEENNIWNVIFDEQ